MAAIETNTIRETTQSVKTMPDLDDMCVDAECQLEDLHNLIWAAKELIADPQYNPAMSDHELMFRTASVLRCALAAAEKLSALLGQIEVAHHGKNHQ